jgi:hypothetical protein
VVCSNDVWEKNTKEERQSIERSKIMIKGTIFTINGTPIHTVGEFKYLERILTETSMTGQQYDGQSTGLRQYGVSCNIYLRKTTQA